MKRLLKNTISMKRPHKKVSEKRALKESRQHQSNKSLMSRAKEATKVSLKALQAASIDSRMRFEAALEGPGSHEAL